VKPNLEAEGVLAKPSESLICLRLVVPKASILGFKKKLFLMATTAYIAQIAFAALN